jgi:hypothetical protein
MLRLLFLSLLLLIGCSSKEEQALLSTYQKKVEYHKNLQQTERTELHSNGEVVATMIATYTFRKTTDKSDTRDETFLVAVDFEEENATMRFNSSIDQESNESNGTVARSSNLDYTLTLHGNDPIVVKKLLSNDPRLASVSFVTNWSHYYEVTFKHTKSKQFNLKFSNEVYGESSLHFSKVARFVYTQKGF